MPREVSDLHLSEITKECNPSLEEFLAHKRLKMKCWYHKPGSPMPSESQNSVDAFHSFPCQIMSVLQVFILKHQGTSWKSPTPPERGLGACMQQEPQQLQGCARARNQYTLPAWRTPEGHNKGGISSAQTTAKI